VLDQDEIAQVWCLRMVGYTPWRVAEILGLKETTVHQLCAHMKIPGRNEDDVGSRDNREGR
jgi:DNA-binding CsgD family transcriptional regulator